MDPGFYRKSNALYTKRVYLGHNIAEIDMKKNDTIKITLRTIDENGKIHTTKADCKGFHFDVQFPGKPKINFDKGAIEALSLTAI